MNADQARQEIDQTFGLVPMMFQELPDWLTASDWESWKRLSLEDNSVIPAKYRELIGLAVSGATRCRYCVYFHTQAARLFGATEDEIRDAALVAKNTMGWSTWLNTRGYDWDAFQRECDTVMEHVRQKMLAPA